MDETLCWTCKYCTGATLPHPKSTSPNGLYRCPWVTEQQPVPGWTATPQKLKIKPDETIDSYCIHECPYYLPDLEAQINALPIQEIARRLEISTTFVADHKKICKQILYTYTKEYERCVKEIKQYILNTGNKTPEGANKKGKPNAQKRYELKTNIVKELLDFAQESLADMETIEDSSKDERDYKIQLSQNVKDCAELLRNINYHYKQLQLRKTSVNVK